MHSTLSHSSSARKKLLEVEDSIKKEQSQSGYLGRTWSRQHSKMYQSILRPSMEESQRAMKRQYSTKGYSTNLVNRTPSSKTGSKLIDIQLLSLQGQPKFKPLKTSKSSKYHDQHQIKIQNQDDTQQHNVQEEKNNSKVIPQVNYDTDEIRSARQNELMEAKKVPFEFSFVAYLIEIMIGYGLFIGIMYLIKLGNFPYFQILLIFTLTLTIHPYKTSTIILPLTAIPIAITNHYLNLSTLTYPQILICYLATMSFNQKYKIKLIFIMVIILQLVFAFIIFPGLYKLTSSTQTVFYYLFPLLMFVLRNLVQLGYWVVGYSEGLFLQIPLLMMGVEVGVGMMVGVSEIEFWYLIVGMTLQVMNDRTHFFLKVMVNMVRFCFPQMKTTPTPDAIKRNNHILPAHWNGYCSINSFHIVACVYLITQLPLTSSPYSTQFTLSSYTIDQWYKPLIIWSLVSVYQIMCIVLQRRKQNVLLIGYTSNRWYQVVKRGVMLVMGLWVFYIGLGVGKLCRGY